jgi:isopenicillin N synthase-like dioxygenase
MADLALYNQIPSLNLADFTTGDPARRDSFVQALGDAFTNIGFVAIRNHGLTDDLTANPRFGGVFQRPRRGKKEI